MYVYKEVFIYIYTDIYTVSREERAQKPSKCCETCTKPSASHSHSSPHQVLDKRQCAVHRKLHFMWAQVACPVAWRRSTVCLLSQRQALS